MVAAHCAGALTRIIDAAREGDHFDVGEHAVFDVDRRDVAGVIGVVLSRLRSGLPTHLCGLSFECQGAFAT